MKTKATRIPVERTMSNIPDTSLSMWPNKAQSREELGRRDEPSSVRHTVASGVMVLDPARPAHVREGMFAGDCYPLWLRFSGDVAPDPDDADNGTITATRSG